MLLTIVLSLTFALSPLDIYRNNTGVEQLASKDKNVSFLDLIQKHPEDWHFYWNQSQVALKNKDYEAAAQMLRWLLTKIPEKESLWRFQVYYQLGRLLSEEKKVEEALQAYQAALDLYPSSKEVTINIELLSSQSEGGSGGESDEQNQQDKQDQQEQQESESDQNQNKPEPQTKPTPKPFESKDLSKEDVRRILEELKRQEEEIRAKIDDKKPKENSLGKDW